MLSIQLLDDLPSHLHRERPDLTSTYASATSAVTHIRTQCHALINCLFSAYENEYTIFAPLSNCFELYGLDVMVDQELGVHFLEANPGMSVCVYYSVFICVCHTICVYE